MPKKVLYTASTEIHLRNFHLPYMNWFLESGYEVHAAFSGNAQFKEASVCHNIPFDRSPLSRKNIQVLFQLIKLIRLHKFDVIHCHTPTASVITRLAYILSFRWKSFVFYTAHGFYFYKGSNLKNWIIFYPIELMMALITDCIITMNDEDWGYISSPLFRCRHKYNIDGIGVNPSRLTHAVNQDSSSLLKQELEISSQEIVFIYIAEFNKRKNHTYIFNSINQLIKQDFSEFKVLFAGGFSTEKKTCEEFAIQNGFIDKVRFLGYRNDIGKLISMADVGITSSRTEGLPIGVLELIYSKKPVLASRIRGHKEILKDGENGYLIDLDDPTSLADKMKMFIESPEMIEKIGENAPRTIDKFLLKNASEKMFSVYQKCLGHS
jgi:glycosyltransferase EpsD